MGCVLLRRENYLYGLKDDTDVLAPFPMSTIHSNATPYSTSSAKSTMTVKFCHEDARAAIERADYVKLDFNPQRATLGLTAVKLVKTGDTGNDFKLLESIGGYDLTPTFGALIADSATAIAGGDCRHLRCREKDSHAHGVRLGRSQAQSAQDAP